MIPPERPQGVEYFIERENYTRGFLAMLANKQRAQLMLGDTHSTYGTGKTNMLCKLYYDIKKGLDNKIPIWLSLSEFSATSEKPKFITLSDVEVLAQNLHSYHELLMSFASEVLNAKENSTLLNNTLKALKKILQVACHMTLTEEERDNFSLDMFMRIARRIIDSQDNEQIHNLKIAIEDSAESFSDEFLNLFNNKSFHTNYIIFADDYCWIGDEAIGRWFVDYLTSKLFNTTVVISRTRETKSQLSERDWWTLQLTNFTPEEVSDYLEKRLNARPLPIGLAEEVYHFSKGHAQTVSLITDLLDYGRDESTHGIPPLKLSSADSTLSEQIQALCRTLLGNIRKKSQPLTVALMVGALSRRFDRELLGYVLGERFGKPYSRWQEDEEEDLDPRSAEAKKLRRDKEAHNKRRDKALDDLLHQLERYSFVEFYPSKPTPYYAFHKFFSAQMKQVLEQSHSKDVEKLHGQIADYYQALLDSYENMHEEDAQYQHLYRYEDKGWQDTISEWAYHSANVSDRADTKEKFASVFFSAFSWWGWFTSFEFCENLLAQWSWSQHERDAHFLDNLNRFYKAYPTGYFTKKDGKGDWDAVRDSLYAIFEELEIDPKAPMSMDSDDKKIIYVMISEMLAGAYRHHVHPNFEEALKIYQNTTAICEAMGEDMEDTLGYHTCFMGDLFLQMGENERAIEQGKHAIETMLQETEQLSEMNDYEQVSLAFRIMGTGYLRLGDYESALKAYSLSSLSAYIFISFPKELADPYTIEWYSETIEDIVEQLLKAWAHQPEAVESIATELQAFWQVYWKRHTHPSDHLSSLLAQGEIDALKAALFPKEPDKHDKSLEEKGHPYNLEVLNVAREVHNRLQVI